MGPIYFNIFFALLFPFLRPILFETPPFRVYAIFCTDNQQ